MNFQKLLQPGSIGHMNLKNRFVVPPMGTNFGNYEGYVTDRMIQYYAARARGGFGLIISHRSERTSHCRAGRALER